MKYFFFDIDGTLLYENLEGQEIVPDSTLQAIAELKRNGHFVAIATSRPNILTEPVAKQLGIDNYVSDGGDGYCISGGKHEISPLSLEDCLDLLKEADALQIATAVSVDTTNNRYSRDGRFIAKHGYLKDAFCFVTKPDFDAKKAEAIYKICLDVSLQQEEQMPTLQKVPHYRITDTCILVEAMDKYKGIRNILRELQGNEEDVVVFGDGVNDIPMFLQAAYSVAMGNSVTELKKIAKYITKDIQDDGIYYACKQHQWI